jgi:hypothetical protein
MRLVFYGFADQGAWPEHPGFGAAALDEEVVGPLRLLNHVETMLGLGRPAVAGVQISAHCAILSSPRGPHGVVDWPTSNPTCTPSRAGSPAGNVTRKPVATASG